MEETIDGGFVCRRLLLGNHFCSDDLERQGHGRQQDEDGIDDCGVAEAFGSEISRNGDVVCEIDPGIEPGPGKQDDAAGNDACLQGLSGLDNRTYHSEWVSMRFLKELRLSLAF